MSNNTIISMLSFDLSRAQHILPVRCISSCTTDRAENPELWLFIWSNKAAVNYYYLGVHAVVRIRTPHLTPPLQQKFTIHTDFRGTKVRHICCTSSPESQISHGPIATYLFTCQFEPTAPNDSKMTVGATSSPKGQRYMTQYTCY